MFACALKPGGHFITATHVGDEDLARTEAHGGARALDDLPLAGRNLSSP